MTISALNARNSSDLMGVNGGETLDERHGFAVFIDDHKFILCMLVAILFGLMPLYGEWTARTSRLGT